MKRNILTKRELEVLDLIIKGYNNREIGDNIFLSDRTVETHRRSIALKLGARNSAHLVYISMEMGLLGSQDKNIVLENLDGKIIIINNLSYRLNLIAG